MEPVSLTLLAIAGILVLGAAGELIFERTSIPDVLWLIAAGIVLGPVLGLVTHAQVEAIAPVFAAIALIVILFDGGSRLRFGEIVRAAPRAGLLAVVGFTASVAVIAPLTMAAAAFGVLPAGWSWGHAIMTGAIVGGSSSIIVMPSFARANGAPWTRDVLNLESALTDVLCIVLTLAILRAIGGSAGPEGPLGDLLRSFGVAIGIGVLAAAVWILLLRRLRDSDYAYPVTLAALFGLYVLVDQAGGSAPLGILAFAIVVGNASEIAAALELPLGTSLSWTVRVFHGEVAFIVKSFFFTFIGLMLTFSGALAVLGIALGLALLLARIGATRLALLGSGRGARSTGEIAVALPRGLAAAALATVPASRGIALAAELPALVFPCVITTIVLFAIGLPIVRRLTAEEPAAAEGAAVAEPVPAG